MPTEYKSPPASTRTQGDICSLACRLLTCVLSASVSSGCGDPLLARVAVVQTEDVQADDDADADSEVDDDAGGKVLSTRRDAGRPDGAPSRTLDIDPDCVALPDMGFAPNAVPEGSEVLATNGAELGCPSADAGVLLRNDVVYDMLNGARFVEKGELYSLHWNSLTIITRVRIHGGEDTCPREPLVDVPTATFIKGSVVATTCQDFRAPMASSRLHLYGNEDFTTIGSSFKFCRRGCAPNTQFVEDAGVGWDGGPTRQP